jgi:hypothetical protein
MLTISIFHVGAHAAESRARVFAPSASEPRILVMYGFIVSIYGFDVYLVLDFGLPAGVLVGYFWLAM